MIIVILIIFGYYIYYKKGDILFMNYNIGTCHVGSDIKQTVSEAVVDFDNPKLIIFNAPADKFTEIAKEIHARFPRAISMGLSTIVGITNKSVSKNELVVCGIESGVVCAADILDDIDKYPIRYASRVEKCVKEVGNNRNTICLEFTTALLCAEESVLSTLNSVLLTKNIPIVGGSAGNGGSGETYVALNGVVRPKTAVFCIIHNESGPVHIFKENIYKPVKGVGDMIAYKVDIKNRIVKEYNRTPAAEAYAKALGVSVNASANYFDTHPLGRVAGNELLITANKEITADNGVEYHARIYNNTRMKLLEPDDYKKVNQQTIEKIRDKVPNPKFAIMVHCLARSLLFMNEGYMSEYVRLMGGCLGNYIGFSGYGEQFGQFHFNQTAVLTVFE